MANKYKWYVVWNGVNTGIFETWDDCKLQVENYPGAKYKSFNSREEAIRAYRGNPDEQMAVLRAIANAPAEKVNYAAFPEIIPDSIAVDAACSGNPGVMEYRGVDLATGIQLFHKGPFKLATNNIGEFLAIVHALALLKQQGSAKAVYSDSRTALAWVRDRKCKTKITENHKNADLFAIIRRAEAWLAANSYSTRVIKWKTEEWGEIPADFGRK